MNLRGHSFLIRPLLPLVILYLGLSVVASCDSEKPPVAPAIKLRDSIPAMVSYGVSKLISDSGVIRYKVVAEKWEVYDRTIPTRQVFDKGLLLEKFNDKFHAQMYLTADTAYWYNEDLWELRGRVKLWNEQGVRYSSELLYWNMSKHEFYSNKYSHLITPDREVEGNSFHSNEQMTRYEVNVTKASFPLPETQSEQDTVAVVTDSVAQPLPGPDSKEKRGIVPKEVNEKVEPEPSGGHFR